MRNAAFYEDIPFTVTDNDQDGWKRFPISFVHIVEMAGEDGLPIYGIRMRCITGNLAMICSPVADLSSIHKHVEHERFVLAMGYTLIKREMIEHMVSV